MQVDDEFVDMVVALVKQEQSAAVFFLCYFLSVLYVYLECISSMHT